MSEHEVFVLVPYRLVADLHGVMRALEQDTGGDGEGLDEVQRKHFRRLLKKVHREIKSCYEVREDAS
jgi:hypothetical protein